MAFKMKGSAFYGKGNQSPSAFLKETNQPPEGRTSTKESNEPDEKAWYEKAYDKASQVGMGVKKAASKMFLDDAASQRRLSSGETLDIGKYYRKGRDDEKAHDDAPTKKSALKHVNGMKVHSHEDDDKEVTTRNSVAVADPDKAIKPHGGDQEFKSRAEQLAFEEKERNRKIPEDRDYQYEGKSQLDELKDLGVGNYIRKKTSGKISGKKYKDWQ